MVIIPAIDLKQGRCVRLMQGEMDRETVYSDNPAAQAAAWENAGASIIHIVDLDGAVEGKPKNAAAIRAICGAVKCRVQLGGGVRDMATASEYFSLGVSRIVLGTLLIKDPAAAEAIVRAFPGRVLAGIDAKNGMAAGEGWKNASAVGAEELAARLSGWPLAGVIFTDIARDGMMQGANTSAVAGIAKATPLPVIASGGVSGRADLAALSQIPGVWGAIIGKALYTGAVDLAAAIKEFERGDRPAC